MKSEDYMSRQSRPTMLQVQYVEELRKSPKKRGAVARIAEKCQVNHAAVSRFFKRCIESGYMDENYELTESGEVWLQQYVEKKNEVFLYFCNLGMTPKEAMENTKILMESMDLHTISLIVRRKKRAKSSNIQRNSTNVDVTHILKKGSFEVGFQLFKYHQDKNKIGEVSMADQGFSKPAVLQKNNRGVYLELTIKEMKAVSRITGELMTGHLTGLKYEENGVIVKPVIRGGKVKIPLEVFQVQDTGEGRIEASLLIMATCSVGRKHMPESSALLIVWF